MNGQYFLDKALACEQGWHETGSPIDQINYIAYMGGEHKFMFDEVNLISLIQQAGFERVSLRSFDERIDLPEREFESIYAEGFKPT